MKHILILFLCCWLLALAGCQTQTVPAKPGPPTRTPTPSPCPPPPQPSATSISGTPRPTAAIQPVSLPFPPEAWQTHWNEAGQFILQYPKQADFYEGQVPSVDGVLTPAANTIAVHSVDQANYILALTYFDLPPGTALPDFIDAHSQCADVSSAAGDPYQLPGSPPGQLFPDTRCGPYHTSYLYLIQGRKGYRFTVESAASYAEAAPFIQPILASFRSFAPLPKPTAPPLGRRPSRLDWLDD